MYRNELLLPAADFARYRFISLEAAKRSTRESRRSFLGDIRRVERKGYPDVAFVREIFCHFPVNTHLEQPLDRARFAEIDIPSALLKLAPSLADIGGRAQTGPINVQLDPT